MKKVLIIFMCIISVLIVGCTNKNSDDDDINASNIAVIYFSATKSTKRVADYIANHYKVDAIEIVPETPYTTSDLDYTDHSSRVYQEHQNRDSRPKIENDIDITKYDCIFLGYPIWWGEAPNIMYSFVESKDFTNKTIVPFTTSASSGIGSSAVNLARNQNGNWLSGKRFSSTVSEKTVLEWLKELNLTLNN